jgi:hypothetical protein
MPLDFLLDVAERGSTRFRERAKIAAKKIGDTVLAKGLLPTETVPASYVPKDGTPNVSVNQLRRLDVPLQLVRLSKLTGDRAMRKRRASRSRRCSSRTSGGDMGRDRSGLR